MKKAFTILELLVVIAVLAILIGIALPRFKGMQDQGKIVKAKAELRTIMSALESYYLFKNPRAYPPTVTNVQAAYLIEAAPQLISSPLYDPFSSTGVEYNYRLSSSGRYYTVWSVGLNGTSGTSAIADSGVVTSSGDICMTNGSGCEYSSNGTGSGTGTGTGTGGATDIGNSCSSGSDCQSGYCDNIPMTAACTNGAPGDRCSSSSDCSTGYCGTDQSLTSICTTGALGDGCHNNSECLSGFCGQHVGLGYPSCSTGAPGAFCTSDDECQSGSCNLAAPNSCN